MTLMADVSSTIAIASSVFLRSEQNGNEFDGHSIPVLPSMSQNFLTLFAPISKLQIADSPKRDFLSSLRNRFPHVLDKVLNYLTPPDLIKCLRICRSWRQIVLSCPRLVVSINQHRVECKTNAENIYKKDRTTRSEHQGPMVNLTNITTQKRLSDRADTNTDATQIPSCSHAHIAQTGDTGSRKRPVDSNTVAGSKKSKKRLRRL